jgi:hypothetical protein
LHIISANKTGDVMTRIGGDSGGGVTIFSGTDDISEIGSLPKTVVPRILSPKDLKNLRGRCEIESDRHGFYSNLAFALAIILTILIVAVSAAGFPYVAWFLLVPAVLCVVGFTDRRISNQYLDYYKELKPDELMP